MLIFSFFQDAVMGTINLRSHLLSLAATGGANFPKMTLFF